MNAPLLRYRYVLVRAVLLGIFTGLFGVAFLIGTEELTELIWPEWENEGWFSGNIWTFLIPIVAGLLVGLTYRIFRLPPRIPGFIDDLKDGEVDPKATRGALGVAVISLVGGSSVGPEAPLGAAGGAVGTWLAQRRNADSEEVRQMSFIGISGAFGGLMSTPIGGPLLAFELEHDQTRNYYYTSLVPGIIAGAISFGIMWPIVGAPFQGLLEIPHGDFRSWMLLAAVGLGVLAAAAAAVVGKLMAAIVGLMRRLDSRPILRGLIGGVAVGAIGYTMPLTLFSGQTSLPVILEDYESFGVLMLLALALLKMSALGISLGGGFFGGPIFPTFFTGAVLGIAVHNMFPDIPLVLAVGSMMAALGAAIALLPLSMAILTAILIESGLEFFAAVVVASVTAYAIRVALTGPDGTGDMQKTASVDAE